MQKIFVRIAVGVGLVAAVLGASAAPASAHAELLSTEPANGAVLDTAPTEIKLNFSEAVEPPSDAIQVFDSDGEQLDVGDVERPDGGKGVSAGLPELEDGAYVVTWKVTSADSHPIRGAFTFRVGPAGSADADAEAEALMDRLVAGQGGDTTVGFLYGVVRFFGFAGMILLVGGAAFVGLLWPAGADDARVRRLIGAGWVTTLVTTLLSFGFQGAYAEGESLGGVFDPSIIGETLDTRAGRIWVLRLVLLVVVLVARRWLLPPVSTIAGAVAGLALLSTISFAGHAGSGDLIPLALVADVGHLAGVAFWIAGLALLMAVVLRRRTASEDDDLDGLAAVVNGFSTWAAVAVAVIVVTGTIQGIRQTQGIDALVDTTYGRLLILKVALFLGIFGAAVFSRTWVQNRRAATAGAAVDVSPGPGAKAVTEDVTTPAESAAEGKRPTIGSLRRSVGIEAALAVGVLAVTALLVNTVPGREAGSSSSFEAELHGSSMLVRVEVDPATAGTSDVRLEVLTHGGEPLELLSLDASLSLPDRGIAPIPLVLEPVEGQPGVYDAPDTDIPLAGTWQLAVSARLSEFDEDDVTTEVPID